MTTHTTNPRSVLGALRSLMPSRPLEDHESFGIAERQALKMLGILDQHTPAVNVAALAELPKIEVRVEPRLPVSGFSQWTRGHWLIGVNRDDAPVRRRFTLAHEFKHVLDHPFIDGAYLDRQGRPSDSRAELVCDYFAACLLMPRPWVKQAWVGGIQDQRALAKLFDVSESAMSLRLRDLGLTDQGSRHRLPETTTSNLSRYFRRGLLTDHPTSVRVGSPLLAGGH